MDHEALKSLLNSPHPSGKLAHWGLAIQELDLHIHYQPERKNEKVDALSRSLCEGEDRGGNIDERVVATIGASGPLPPLKGGDPSLSDLQCSDRTLSLLLVFRGWNHSLRRR